MRYKTLRLLIFILLLGCSAGFAQSTFLGLTPGKSTKVDAERVLGQPVKKVSETLIEYSPRQIELARAGVTFNSGKIYVQYGDRSTAAVAERIELVICARESFSPERECDKYLPAMHTEFDPGISPSTGSLDAFQNIQDANGFKTVWYFGPPRYMMRTTIDRNGPTGSTAETRWGFYSRALYDSVAPTGNCLGTLWGEWETNLGRMTITRINEFGKLRGTYAQNSGTFTGNTSGPDGLEAEWKDSTGSGTMFIQMPFLGGKTFTGSSNRIVGSGPKKSSL